jgi:hypothetical protein
MDQTLEILGVTTCSHKIQQLIGGAHEQKDISEPPQFVEMDNPPQKISQKTVSQSIEILVDKLDLNYVDAIMQAIQFYEIPIEDSKKFLSSKIIEKLKNESIKMHLLRDTSRVEALI